MINYKGMKSEMYRTYEQLPAGGYICKILGVKKVEKPWGLVLDMQCDIAEGEYKGKFMKEYNENTREDKKFGCVYSINIPNEKREDFDTQVSRFNNFIGCVEDATDGYHWDGEENSLKGKKICLLFRRKEWSVDGRSGFKCKPIKCISFEDCKSGNWGDCSDIPLKNKTAPASPIAEDEGDLPWIL